MKEELQVAENKKQEAVAAYNAVCEKLNRTNSELSNVSATVRKLRSAQSEYTNSINELKDKIESSEATSADVFVSNQDYLLKYYSFFSRAYSIEQIAALFNLLLLA